MGDCFSGNILKIRGINTLQLYLLTEPNGAVLNSAFYNGMQGNYGGKEHAATIMFWQKKS